MKITECYLHNFGRFRGFRISFKEGLNCISAPNGYGKSTVCDFIRIMLFGMRDTKRSGTVENDRRRYLPWDGGLCSGTLTFTTKEGNYRIERTFGTKASEDTLKVYNCLSGMEESFGSKPGERLLGVDGDTFERTAFVSDREFSLPSGSETINERLTARKRHSEVLGAVSDALDTLEEQRRIFYKKGGSGEIAELKERVIVLENEIVSTKKSKAELEELHAKLDALSSRIRDAERDLAFSRDDYDRVRLTELNKTFVKREAELCDRIAEDSARLSEIEAVFGGKVPTPLSKNELFTCEESGNETDGYKGIFEAHGITESDIKRATQLAEKFADSKKPGGIGLMISGLALIALGACGCFLNQLFLILCGIGAVVFSIAIIKKLRKSAKDLSRKEELRSFIALFGLDDAEDRQGAVETISRAFWNYRNGKEDEKEKHADEKKREDMRELALEYSYLKDAKQRKETELSELRDGYKQSGAYSYRTTQTSEDVRRREDGIRLLLRTLEEERSRLRILANDLELKTEMLGDLIAEADVTRARLSDAEEELEIIMETKKYLTQARELVASSNLGETARRFTEIVEAIDTNCATGVSLDTSFEAKRSEGGVTHPSDAYSRGIRELYDFSAKLAVSDSLYPEKLPPLLLDDPFVYLDDNKLERAKQLLFSLADKRQVLYFTASRSREL